MKKLCRKCPPKASTRPLFNLVNNPQHPLHTKNSFEKEIFSKRIIKKP